MLRNTVVDASPGDRAQSREEENTVGQLIDQEEGDGSPSSTVPVAELEPSAETPSEPGGKKSGQSSVRSLLVEILQTVLLTLIIFAGVRSVVQNFKVDGASMEPTLHTGEYLLINKFSYFRLDGPPLQLAESVGLTPKNSDGYYPFGGPHRGDIVVFKYPEGPDRDFIKRVIGLPGDIVQVDRGRVYVNGVMLQENYIRALPTYSVAAEKVPPGEFFVLGDNRPNSSDSHIWGYVPQDNMIGKAWVSYWPPDEWGLVAGRGMAGSP
jgi:signal peptidase I